MATFSGFCLRAFAASRLESAVKQVGGSGGDRDGSGGIRVGDAEVCARVCAWGALHAADQAGRWGGIGRRRRRQGQGQWRCPGMVATAASGMQPARRGGRWARPLRAARVRTTKQLCDAAMVTCVRGDGKGRAAARAHRALSLDGEGGGEREQPGPRTGNARRH